MLVEGYEQRDRISEYKSKGTQLKPAQVFDPVTALRTKGIQW